jgi:PIN domain-containing protein
MFSAERPEYFLDRSLGKETASRLRDAGYVIHLIADHYPRDASDIPDEDWIAEGCSNRWVLLTKDKRIRYRLLVRIARTAQTRPSAGAISACQVDDPRFRRRRAEMTSATADPRHQGSVQQVRPRYVPPRFAGVICGEAGWGGVDVIGIGVARAEFCPQVRQRAGQDQIDDQPPDYACCRPQVANPARSWILRRTASR